MAAKEGARGVSDRVIDVSHLRKSYGATEALRGISFNLARGEVFGFLGHNGAGKTTTIRLVLGLLKPDAGKVLLFGEDPYSDDGARQALRRRVGVLLEEDRLYPHMTGEENLRFWAELYGLPRQEADRQIDRVLRLVDMASRAHSPVGTYSKGMRRRLAVARALVNRPELVIMDEPTAGLDPAARAQLRELLENLVALEGITVFLASHDLAEVQKLCQRVAILARGEVILSGTLEELRREQQPQLAVSLASSASGLLPDSLRQALEALPFVQGVDLCGGELCLTLKEDSPDHRATVVDLLVSRGARISQVRQVSRSLEEVYLATMQQHEKNVTS